ncbi:MAG: hypothetical protein ACREA9_19835, partial [Pyrinomonadaceae bacterium]
MKHIRQQLIILILGSLMLQPFFLRNAHTQQESQGKKDYDKYTTVVGAAYPAAGAVFMATGEMLELFGYFGGTSSSSDPIGDAIKRINERLDVLEKRMKALNDLLQRLVNRQLLSENRERLRFLNDRHQEIQDLVDDLQAKPSEIGARRALANKAQRIAGRFLNDPEMDIWKWSDMREKDQKLFPADFKSLPALEYYVLSVVTVMAAIDNATDGDYAFVKR